MVMHLFWLFNVVFMGVIDAIIMSIVIEDVPSITCVMLGTYIIQVNKSKFFLDHDDNSL